MLTLYDWSGHFVRRYTDLVSCCSISIIASLASSIEVNESIKYALSLPFASEVVIFVAE